MELKNKTFKIVFAYAFVVALLLPTVVQLVHSVEGHDEHSVCTNFKTHIHKQKVDCPICAFHFSTFSYTSEELVSFIQLEENYKIESGYSFPEFASAPPHYLLRGPPQFS